MAAKKLTAKQEKFCQQYFITNNATQSAIAAGYSQDTAAVIGHENLRKPNIAARIKELRSDEADKYEFSKERIIREYMKIAFSDMADFLNDHGDFKKFEELTPMQRGAMSESYYNQVVMEGEFGSKTTTTKKIKLHDKQRALDALGKILGVFEEDNRQKTDITISTTEERDARIAALQAKLGK